MLFPPQLCQVIWNNSGKLLISCAGNTGEDLLTALGREKLAQLEGNPALFGIVCDLMPDPLKGICKGIL